MDIDENGRNGLFLHPDSEALPYPSHPEDKIPKSWLIKRINENEKIENDSFGWYRPDNTAKNIMEPGDELWAFANYFPLVFRAGIAIIRDGIIIHASLRMMS